jgi:hypothetical protein
MSIRAKQRFYNHATKLGIDLANLEIENLDFSLPAKPKSSFKKRANEIKEMYNHRFNFRPEPRVIDLGVCYLEFDKL